MEVKKGPWRILSSEIKYKNPWIKVIEEKVLNDDGVDGLYGVVNMQDGVSVLPIDDSGFVYLTEEFKYAIEKNSIELVSGGIDGNEKELEAAKRELKEELGISANEWIYMGELSPFTSVINSKVSLYIARDLSFGKSLENIKMIKMTLEQAKDMVMNSEIIHGPSACLILKAYLDFKKSL